MLVESQEERYKRLSRNECPNFRRVIELVVEAYARCMVEELLATDHAIKIVIRDYNG